MWNTTATTLFELFSNMNADTNNLAGIVLIISVYIMIFLISLRSVYGTPIISFSIMSFVGLIFTVLFYIVGLVNGTVIDYSIGLFIISLLIILFGGRNR